MAHALLFPANAIATAKPDVLPIEEATLPTEDVSDLKDVFDAINRLCDTMKTSAYTEPEYSECACADGIVEPQEVIVRKVEILRADRFECESASEDRWTEAASPSADKPADWKDSQASLASSEISVHRESWRDIVSPTVEVDPRRERWKDSQASLASSDVSVQRDGREGPEERWSDTLTSPPSSDVSVTREARERWSECRSPPDSAAPQEPSETYYTASSEVSLLSDTELLDKADKKECVIAGHVAAMRERFESMTRANTPCPSSPSLDVFRNITPSPDPLG